MRVNWLEFENYTTGQKIERINFDKLNLLVGESGAGKTQILKILSLYSNVVVKGQMIPFAGHFKIQFSVSPIIIDYPNELDNKIFTWEIETNNDHSLNTNSSFSYGIIKELLLKEDVIIFERDEKNLTFLSETIPNISSDKSILNVFTNPTDIANINTNFWEIISYFSQEVGLSPMPLKDVHFFKQIFKGEIKTFGELNNKRFLMRYSALIKIFIMREFFPEDYQLFLEKLKNIFPVIEDIKVDVDENIKQYNLFIKENGQWIPKDEISGGMLKTIYILCVVEFSTNESVILLDELENSLGVNCLDEITDYICDESYTSNTQFILTSHHPYIINQIPENHWRIISQNNGIVSSKRAIDVGIDTSKNRQDKFFQYINFMKRRN